MKYRFLISSVHKFPGDLTATMPLGLPMTMEVESCYVRSLGDGTGRYDFDLPDDMTIAQAQRFGLGCAFTSGFNAFDSVSRLFVLKHSNESNVGKRSTDWSPAYG